MDHRGNNDWFDDFMIMQMCDENKAGDKGRQSSGGGVPVWLWVIIALAFLKLIF